MGKRRIAGDETMAALAEAIGADAARQLARHFGGTKLFVPRVAGEHHPIRAALGQPAADTLLSLYGGAFVYVPKQPERRARVRELHRERALTVAGIAAETGYSERHVYRLLRDDDDRQLDLFEEN